MWRAVAYAERSRLRRKAIVAEVVASALISDVLPRRIGWGA